MLPPALGSTHDPGGVPNFAKCIDNEVLIMKYPQQIAMHIFVNEKYFLLFILWSMNMMNN